MKSIHNLNDLHPFGVKALTGEACRVGRRVLCDLTQQGEDIVRNLLGLPGGGARCFGLPWNSGAVSSFLMPYPLFEDLAIWCLIDAGCTQVIIVSDESKNGLHCEGGIFGVESIDDPAGVEEWLAHLRRYEFSYRVIKINDKLPGADTRCTHQMTGRTE